MDKTLPRVALLIVGALLVFGACGSDSDSDSDSAGGDGLAVTATEFAFDPDTLTVAPDTEFTVDLTNAGAVEHDFTIEGEEADLIFADAGATESGSFTLAAGDYVFYCAVAGHREAGMEGTLTVG